MERKITETNQINTGTEEGRLLLLAISKITVESQTDKSPEQVLEQLNKLEDCINRENPKPDAPPPST